MSRPGAGTLCPAAAASPRPGPTPGSRTRCRCRRQTPPPAMSSPGRPAAAPPPASLAAHCHQLCQSALLDCRRPHSRCTSRAQRHSGLAVCSMCPCSCCRPSFCIQQGDGEPLQVGGPNGSIHQATHSVSAQQCRLQVRRPSPLHLQRSLPPSADGKSQHCWAAGTCTGAERGRGPAAPFQWDAGSAFVLLTPYC